ncbi:MAG: hypothetical protein ACI8XG_001022 [Congregibacter sp.]
MPEYLLDDEYRGLQSYFLEKPDSGAIVNGSGSVRKMRWASLGKDKSAGVSARKVQVWEQSRRNPQGPAEALLKIAEQHPEVFSELR